MANNVKSPLKPLGIRLNNPLNIKYNKFNRWKGSNYTEGVFESFKDSAYGIRAAMLIISSYIGKHGLRTIPEIINRFAPKSENLTENYIAVVNREMEEMGYNPKEMELKNEKDWDTIRDLVYAMALMEVGRNYRPGIEEFHEAVELI